MMQSYNLLMILNRDKTKILTLKRTKDPYKGLYNLPGGKMEKNESKIDAAYRELEEETGIRKMQIELYPFMDYVWHPLHIKMYVYIGKLKEEVVLKEETHPLFWHSINNDFYDMKIYAGEGNIGHMVTIYKQLKHHILK